MLSRGCPKASAGCCAEDLPAVARAQGQRQVRTQGGQERDVDDDVDDDWPARQPTPG